MKLTATLASIATLALAVPTGAAAHVTLQPDEATAGDYVVLDVRVPNERDGAATTKVDVQFPPGFVFASYEPVPGWTAQVKMERSAQPLSNHGEEVDEQVSQVTWTADSGGDGVQPGQFRDFPISVQIPGHAGDALTFKALQTYENGEVVRWIGAPESDEPAPQVTVSHGEGGHGEDPAADEDSGDGSGSDTLAIVALIVGALGLIVGGAALARARTS